MSLPELRHNETAVDVIYDHIKALAALNADNYEEVKSREGHTFPFV